MPDWKKYLPISRISRLYLVVSLLFINIIFTQLAHSAVNNGYSKKAELAWVKKNGENFDIGYSFYDGNIWKGQLVLSTGNPVNFVPAIAKKQNGDTWLVWSSDTGKRYLLYYAVISGNNEIEGPFQFRTEIRTNATPTIIIDNAETLWMVWSGNNGDDDDIYYSKFLENHWQQPKLVHIDNDNPDIFPKLLLESNGAVVVEWTNLNKIKPQQQKVYLQQGVGGEESLKVYPQTSTTLKDRIFQCVTALPDIENLELSTLQLNCNEDRVVIQFVGKALKKE